MVTMKKATKAKKAKKKSKRGIKMNPEKLSELEKKINELRSFDG